MEDTGIDHALLDRMAKEDTLHAGATRPVMFLGIPIQLAVGLGLLAYAIQINVTGWKGVLWGLSIAGPAWLFCAIAVAHDPYGMSVAFSWVRTCLLSRDRKKWGGMSLSPLPPRFPRGNT